MPIRTWRHYGDHQVAPLRRSSNGSIGAITNTEIAELAQGCRFRDCHHEGEPGCAVAEAATNGQIDPGRWESYQRLGREMRYRQLAADAGPASAERKRWRSVRKEARRMSRG